MQRLKRCGNIRGVCGVVKVPCLISTAHPIANSERDSCNSISIADQLPVQVTTADILQNGKSHPLELVS